jgi:hypothetical protein
MNMSEKAKRLTKWTAAIGSKGNWPTPSDMMFDNTPTTKQMVNDEFEHLQDKLVETIYEAVDGCKIDIEIDLDKRIKEGMEAACDEALGAIDFEHGKNEEKIRKLWDEMEWARASFTAQAKTAATLLDELQKQMKEAKVELDQITKAIEERKKALAEGRWAKIECDSDYA